MEILPPKNAVALRVITIFVGGKVQILEKLCQSTNYIRQKFLEIPQVSGILGQCGPEFHSCTKLFLKKLLNKLQHSSGFHFTRLWTKVEIKGGSAV